MRGWILGLVTGTAASMAAACGGTVSPPVVPDGPPSVLLITIDTLRADAIGAYGNRQAATPWIDRLAAAGVRFEQAHAHSVLTLPSHANILSGLYPPDHGVRDNAGFRFPDTAPTLPGLLKARGYATAAFVSAFPVASRFGLARGFDVYEDGFVDATPRMPLLEQERAGPDTVALARRWLDAHAADRTFLWVHLFEPHAPYAPPEPFASRFPGNPYGGDVAAADAALAPLLAPLLDGHTAKRTLVVLTSDHGEALGEHGEATHGVFAYESTLRVPLILYGPALLTPRVVAMQARHVDLMPTILDAVGETPPAGLRGRSLMRIAAGRPDADAAPLSYFESLSPAFNRGWAPLRGIARGRLKYIDLPIPELYELSDDPGETRNLIESRAADARDLRDRLAEFADGGAAVARAPESAEARERLRSLGYASTTVPLRKTYTERDDPKRLIDLDARLQEAVRLYTAGDHARAIALSRALVSERPDMRVAWMTLAQLQRDGRDLDGAIASMRRAHTLAPGDPQATALLGAYLVEKGAAQDAIAVLAPAAEGAHPDLQILVALGLAQARAGRADAGVATLERARAADPSNGRLLVELGTVQLIANRRDDARRSFESALARNPRLARAHSSLGAMHAEDGRAGDAVAAWREATRLDASEYNRIFLLGMGLARAQRPGPARTCLAFFADQAPAALYGREIAVARAWLTTH